MRRVLMVCAPADGGAPECATELATRLGAHGWEAEFAGPPEARRYARLEDAGVPVHRLSLLPGYGHPVAAVRAATALTRLLRTRRFDLVHCHSAPSGVGGRIAARRVGVPSIYSPHAFPFVGELGGARRLAAGLVERALARTTTLLACCCEEERRQALAHALLPPDRLRVIPNGVPASPDVPAPGFLARMRDGGPVVVAVAHLRRQKRLDVLVDAAPRILREVPSARIAIVGDGPSGPELRAQARRLGLAGDDRFVVTGFVPPAARYLRAADLFVLSSGWEGLPIALLEAQACGVPQVATDVGGVAEAVTSRTGRLVARGDPAALAEAVVSVLRDDGLRARMRADSLRSWAESFTVERMVAGYAAAYEEAVCRGAAGRPGRCA
jgi:glycosyltransferase involved in cell wall biosynthesis